MTRVKPDTISVPSDLSMSEVAPVTSPETISGQGHCHVAAVATNVTASRSMVQSTLHAFFDGGRVPIVAVQQNPRKRKQGAPNPLTHESKHYKRAVSTRKNCDVVLPAPVRRECAWPAVLYRRQRRVQNADIDETPAESRSWLDQLNPAQLEAATARDTALIILAGVGVGKTTTLLARIAELVHRGAKPKRLLLTSFTNKACNELKDRVAAINPKCRKVNILTMHSLAYSIIQAFYMKAGYTRQVQVIDKVPINRLREWWQWATLEQCRIHVARWLGSAKNSSWEQLRAQAEKSDETLHDKLLNFPTSSMARNPKKIRDLRSDDESTCDGKRQHAWRYSIARALYYYVRKAYAPDLHRRLVKNQELQIREIPIRPIVGILPGIRRSIERAKRDRETPTFFKRDSEFRFIYEEYVAWARKECKLDFEDIMDVAIKIAKQKDVRLRLRATFDHILTDETQDINEKQIELLELLNPPAVTLVGDPDQVIFSFAGSMPHVFQRLQKVWPNARVVALQENYRSTAAILQAACIALASDGAVPKNMTAAAPWRDEGGPLEVWQCAEPTDEANAIANEIERVLAAGTPASEICVLLRCFTTMRWKHYNPICRAFASRKIPYFLVRDQSIFSSSVAQDLLSYCQLLLNPRDDDSLQRVLNEPPRRLGSTFCDRLREIAHVQGCTLFEALPHVPAQADSRRNANDFVSVIQRLGRETHNLTPANVLRHIVKETNYMRMSSRHKARGSVARTGRKDNGIANVSDHSDGSDVEGDESLRRIIEALYAEADAWYAQRRQEVNKNKTNEAEPSDRPITNQPPSLWSVCCKAWFALPPDRLSATQPMTAEQRLTVDLVEREAMRGHSVLADFLDDVKLRNAADITGDVVNKAKVQISTIHRAKGGEWDIVFNARFNEGFFPMKMIRSVEKLNYKTGELKMQRHLEMFELQRQLEEERRLAHVAFSRARRRLVVTYVRGVPNGPRGAWNAQALSSITLPETAMYAPPRPATDVEKQAMQIAMKMNRQM